MLSQSVIFPSMVATIWIFIALLASALYSGLRSKEVVKSRVQDLTRSDFLYGRILRFGFGALVDHEMIPNRSTYYRIHHLFGEVHGGSSSQRYYESWYSQFMLTHKCYQQIIISMPELHTETSTKQFDKK